MSASFGHKRRADGVDMRFENGANFAVGSRAMDVSARLLDALSSAQSLGGELTASRIEALGGILGIPPGDLPALMNELQRAGAVELKWGGGAVVLPAKPKSAAGHVINAGTGAFVQVAGGDATAGNVNTAGQAGPTTGQLVALLSAIRTLQPTLQGEAADAARETEIDLATALKPETPPEQRQSLWRQIGSNIKGLLALAPDVKTVVELGTTVAGWFG